MGSFNNKSHRHVLLTGALDAKYIGCNRRSYGTEQAKKAKIRYHWSWKYYRKFNSSGANNSAIYHTGNFRKSSILDEVNILRYLGHKDSIVWGWQWGQKTSVYNTKFSWLCHGCFLALKPRFCYAWTQVDWLVFHVSEAPGRYDLLIEWVYYDWCFSNANINNNIIITTPLLFKLCFYFKPKSTHAGVNWKRQNRSPGCAINAVKSQLSLTLLQCIDFYTFMR